ncbi:MAG: divalent metal cation transporter [Dermatophilaceae bacterium]
MVPAAGIHHGHLLILVVLAANAVAGRVQYLSASLGMATGESLPAICRTRYRPGVRALLWIEAEVVVVMTDVAKSSVGHWPYRSSLASQCCLVWCSSPRSRMR